MANKVFKYELTMGENELELPVGYNPMSVLYQNGKVMLYCMVNESVTEKTTAIFEVVMTGEALVEAGRHVPIGTVSTNADNSFILHVLERKSTWDQY